MPDYLDDTKFWERYVQLNPKTNRLEPLYEPTSQRFGETTIRCPFCKKNTDPRYAYCVKCAKRIDDHVRKLKKKEKRRPEPPSIRKIK